ncbi:sigma factor-like helix-turn-helix DNA-binding protein [Actinokineospora sp. G85]|uniref:sigma factor-like helix-turn-helix DNA-binding protein n=1 Tax=Actinokineospora sp. G85 TaxID=3406626 RepID=UPI003C720A3A
MTTGPEHTGGGIPHRAPGGSPPRPSEPAPPGPPRSRCPPATPPRPPGRSTRSWTAWSSRTSCAPCPPPHRATLAEVYFADRTAAGAAAVLRVPVGTVKSRVHNALRALRTTLPALDAA